MVAPLGVLAGAAIDARVHAAGFLVARESVAHRVVLGVGRGSTKYYSNGTGPAALQFALSLQSRIPSKISIISSFFHSFQSLLVYFDALKARL